MFLINLTSFRKVINSYFAINLRFNVLKRYMTVAPHSGQTEFTLDLMCSRNALAVNSSLKTFRISASFHTKSEVSIV